MQNCVTVIVGTSWGDEGKGKIASMHSADAKLVIRGTGGANAGHSVVFNGKTLPLHLVPGGIIHPQTTCIIGPGCVVDPEVLLDEIDMLSKEGVPLIGSRLKISGHTHVVLPYHKELDQTYETIKGKNPVGTTKRGIGPCYADKANRIGIRMYDLLLQQKELERKLRDLLRHHESFLSLTTHSQITDFAHYCVKLGNRLRNYITDVNPIITAALEKGNKIVVEGAQAYRLDIDHGDYPMVTSSNPSTAGTLCGCGLPPNSVKEVIGIAKAYTSRVGNGPFPTEQESTYSKQPDKMQIGDWIREFGHEYGTTTGRPRRCGWVDCVILHSAKSILGLDHLCINHLDTIGKIGRYLGYIKICTSYWYQGRIINYYPDNINLTGEIPTPIYEIIDGGWELDSSCKNYEDLPKLAKKFIEIVEEASGVPVKYIGTGPANNDMIIRNV